MSHLLTASEQSEMKMNRHLFIALFFCGLTTLFPVVDVGSAQQPRLGGAARLEAWKLHLDRAEASPFKNLQWQDYGPQVCRRPN